MNLMRQIPTPPVPNVVDVDDFLDTILAPEFSAPHLPECGIRPEDNPPLPDAFQIWPPGHWSEDCTGWLNGDYATGWEDFNGFPDQ